MKIKYIYPPHSPVRRIPRSVKMNIVSPSPWACVKCDKPAITYADGVVWCEICEKKLSDSERKDLLRGEQRNTPTPDWTRIEVE
jgi:hypothetical protein